MNNASILKRKWFFPWQDREEETWLEEMSRQGLHLASAEKPGGYVFHHGKPSDFVYRIDYRELDDDEQYYLQIFEDSCWQHVAVSDGWHYFRQQVGEGINPEIFTDADTKIQKFTRIKNRVVFFLALCAMFSIVFSFYPDNEPGSRHWWIGMISNGSGLLFSGLVMVFLVTGYFKLDRRIRKLRNL
jgi:hypothetical protein